MKKVISFCCSVLFLLTCSVKFPVHAEDISEYLNGIIQYQLTQSGSDSVQNWIDTALTENAGISSEWYILALRQSGTYDFSAYQNALHTYLETHEIYSASSRLKYALVLASVGEDSPYITESLENSVGQQGIMSYIYALHLMNNGYICESCSKEEVIHQLLSMQLPDGGWAVMGTVSDIDVTAMALQALSAYYYENSSVQNACDTALLFLSEHQLDYGGYQSFGTENLESTAQVVTALASLGIDAFSDERFIKNNNSLLNGMNAYRLPDGGYSHTRDGICNDTATIQAFYTFVAYQRFQNGQSPLYILDTNYTPEILPETELPSPADSPVVTETELFPETPETTILSEFHEDTEIPVTTVSATVILETSTSITETITETSGSTTTASTAPTQTTKTQTSITQTTKAETSSTTIYTETSVFPSETGKIQHSEPVFFSRQKMIILIILWSIGILISLLFWILKKRNFKNFLFIGILCLTASGLVVFIRIQSAEEYYHQSPIQKENAVGYVTITIRCDTLLDKADSAYIPKDGIILDKTELPLSDGETVYDILMQSAQAYGIQTEHNSSYYISGINYLYEMQYGDLSGWMYRVNGVLPSVGCAEYYLKDGDFIEWLYSCEIGNDLN